MEFSEAFQIVMQHKRDCESIENGFSSRNKLPRHSNTVGLLEAMRILAFLYVDSNKDERDE